MALISKVSSISLTVGAVNAPTVGRVKAYYGTDGENKKRLYLLDEDGNEREVAFSDDITLKDIKEGTNITIDRTDPENPIINATSADSLTIPEKVVSDYKSL